MRKRRPPPWPHQKRWDGLEHAIRLNMHPDFLVVLARLRKIQVGRNFTVFDLGYRGGRRGVNVLPVIQAAEAWEVVKFTGHRAHTPGRAPIGRLRWLVYRRLC